MGVVSRLPPSYGTPGTECVVHRFVFLSIFVVKTRKRCSAQHLIQFIQFIQFIHPSIHPFIHPCIHSFSSASPESTSCREEVRPAKGSRCHGSRQVSPKPQTISSLPSPCDVRHTVSRNYDLKYSAMRNADRAVDFVPDCSLPGTRIHVTKLVHCGLMVNPFTPKSDQFQISPAASPEILHHTVWWTWLFIAYSDERLLCYPFSLHHLYIAL